MNPLLLTLLLTALLGTYIAHWITGRIVTEVKRSNRGGRYRAREAIEYVGIYRPQPPPQLVCVENGVIRRH